MEEYLKGQKKGSKNSSPFLNGPAIKRRTFFLRLPLIEQHNNMFPEDILTRSLDGILKKYNYELQYFLTYNAVQKDWSPLESYFLLFTVYTVSG